MRAAILWLFFWGILSLATVAAQGIKDSTLLAKKLPAYQVKTSIGFQQWFTYSQGMRLLDEESGLYNKVDDRLNFQIRRTRLVLSGQPYANLSYHLTTSLDLVGKDNLSATESAPNNGGSPKFRFWDTVLQWQPSQGESDALHLLVGYFRPPISRESVTSGLRTTSFEKAWSQSYLREHLVGQGHGRAMGMMLGGQLGQEAKKLQLSYEVALQNPVFAAFAGNSTGFTTSVLFTGRVVAHIGDPEHKQYTNGHKINYFSRRKGLSVAAAAAHQSATDLFKSNSAWGIDWLFNWKNFNLDGEWLQLSRQSTGGASLQSSTRHLRLSYNIQLPKKIVLEPVFTHWQFSGPMRLTEQMLAHSMRSATGKDSGWEMGINWYFNADFKLSLFYVARDGKAGEEGPQKAVNSYFQQPGLGNIQRGHYVGLGWISIF